MGTNILFLIIGIIIVLIGIFLMFKESSGKRYTFEIEEILVAISSLENKLDLVLEKIEEEIETIKEMKSPSNENWPVDPVIEQSNSKDKIIQKHKEVYTLYNQGLSAKDIAMKLNRGVGEIETIIALFNFEGDYNG
ncbi:DUF6115 domain-containing protein [Anaerobranca gottschalkii]|uniref:Uncharacterized protein n=1 Tax=Anaerobranca gottschalkii DSM 13577 TaxID=1120990 RepID=A0A1H9ZBS2_9FIRM|nr:hypothetical protein [Anaerobranca gottschalkii]SES79068.1 hypothetical protein SAMN03080614_100814 [Anaerobranca gottschalkii DSM 13577]